MKILLADDEKELTRALNAIFVHSGYKTDIANDGAAALELCLKNEYDVIILDIMMPKMNGLDVLTEIRKQGIDSHVILLTAKAEIEDKIIGLDAGANDYMIKPFAIGELMARIRAATRTKEQTHIVSFGNIELNTETNELKGEKSSLRLSSKETAILKIIMKTPSIPVSAEDISNEIHSENAEELDIYISYLKNKLSAVNADFEIAEDNGYLLRSVNLL